MEDLYSSLFSDIVVIILLSVLLLLLLYRIKIPSVVAFLIAGIIAGPSGLGLIRNEQSIEFFAQLGVIFLLFTIGLEFSISRILQMKRFVLIGGLVQVLLTILIFSIALKFSGMSLNVAFFVGMLISLSSTAIVMKVLTDRREIDSPHGRATLGILIAQDLIVIPMMMITPLLAGEQNDPTSGVTVFLGGFVIIALVIITGRYIIPQLLTYAARIRSREIFLFIVVGTCFFVAYLTSQFGLSMALGAFLAGLIISESEYNMHAMYNIIPFRDIFASFFFISIGMIFNISYLLSHSLLIGGLVIAIIGVKFVTGSIAAVISGLPLRSSLRTGSALGEIGEFSFILAGTGVTLGIMSNEIFQIFLDASIITMGLAPFLIILSGKVTPNLPLPPRFSSCQPPVVAKEEKVRDHIIIIGYGFTGRNVSRSAKIARVPYCIIEMNPDTVRKEKKKGEPIVYGDATEADLLVRVGILDARILVIGINDPFAVQQIVRVAREINPGIYIIARTQFMGEVSTLKELGADEVIPEEFETSVEIFSRILHKYLIPADEIDALVREVRSGGYEMLRSSPENAYTLDDLRLHLPDLDLRTIRITGKFPLCGTMLKDSSFREKYQINVVAIRRGGEMIVSPGGCERILPGDLLMVIGMPVDINAAFAC